MDKDYTVQIVYLNDNKEVVSSRVYTLREYANMIASSVKKMIGDVENVFYDAEGYKPKDEWDIDNVHQFRFMRHKLLDIANSLERLPDQLMYKGIKCNSVTSGEAIANLIENAVEK